MGIPTLAHEIRGAGAVPKLSGIPSLHGAHSPFGAGRVLVEHLAIREVAIATTNAGLAHRLPRAGAVQVVGAREYITVSAAETTGGDIVSCTAFYIR